MNILIVDDDLLIRNWLKILLQQIQNIQTFIFEASNGQEALEACRKNSIELVITDIKMPVINGLDLIESLKKEFPAIRFCVLSSYDDFDYVKNALKAGALDYILKAEMQLDDLSQILVKVQNSIRMEKKYTLDNCEENNQIPAFTALYKEYTRNEEGIDSLPFLQRLSPALSLDNLMIVIFTVLTENDTSGERIASLAMDTILANNYNGIAFPLSHDSSVIFYNSAATILEDQEEEYIKLMSILSNNLSSYEQLSLSDSILLPYKSNKSIKSTIDSGVETIDFCSFYNTNCKKLKLVIEQHSNKSVLYTLIQKHLDLRDYDKITEDTLLFIENAFNRQLIPAKLISAIRGAVRILLSSDIIINSTDQQIVEKLDGLSEDINNSKTYGDLKDTATQFLKEYTNYAKSRLSGRTLSIQTALQYIDDNYMNKITLDDVAKYVYLNSSYLSQLFKKEMNVPFSDYIEEVRIKRAKLLLKETDYSMNQVAEAVGFSTQNYFTRIFKKSTGLTPIKYRNIHSK
ncbi:MAG: response regulator [Anaerocolumna aminovalerica]|uniref:response regulator transcription factor n=1 Tax=Anaerocolumna aminovalerica TaxID=1527 RepID=UPI0029145C19|nr:response regulator [Anaerocolumna aminovalerica]MDU6263225.1 response regulator [Anaerocolumna aminovalerica]